MSTYDSNGQITYVNVKNKTNNFTHIIMVNLVV